MKITLIAALIAPTQAMWPFGIIPNLFNQFQNTFNQFNNESNDVLNSSINCLQKYANKCGTNMWASLVTGCQLRNIESMWNMGGYSEIQVQDYCYKKVEQLQFDKETCKKGGFWQGKVLGKTVSVKDALKVNKCCDIYKDDPAELPVFCPATPQWCEYEAKTGFAWYQAKDSCCASFSKDLGSHCPQPKPPVVHHPKPPVVHKKPVVVKPVVVKPVVVKPVVVKPVVVKPVIKHPVTPPAPKKPKSISSAMGLDINAFELVIDNCTFKNGFVFDLKEKTLIHGDTFDKCACFESAADCAKICGKNKSSSLILLMI